MLTVFCVKVGKLYGQEYVTRLARMFRVYLNMPFNFVCATDDFTNLPQTSLGISYVEPVRKCRTWWNLQEAYSNPSWACDEQILYCGLDTVITRDITDVIQGRIDADKLTLMHDFQCLRPAEQRNSFYEGTYADGVAFVPRGGVPALWSAFMSQVSETSEYPMHVFNTEVLKEEGIVPDFWQEVEPDFLCSYKWPTIKLHCPKEAVVCFHGEPRPIDAAELTPWIKDFWR